jgi:VIT1/CCC1 family predicted Fe2+/Mn2+ transporter
MIEKPTSSKRVLEPYDRISEILFGLIMVLTFTGSFSVAEAGRQHVNAMLIAALGCNFAWGIIDAILYLMGCLAERGRNLKALRALRSASNPERAQRIIAGALPPLVASILEPAEFAAIGQRLNQLPEPPTHVRLHGRDFLGGLAVFFLVFLSTLPVAIPFLLTSQVMMALRISNSIAIVMLFITGCAFGRSTGYRPWMTGLIMVLLGLGLVGLTIALGG